MQRVFRTGIALSALLAWSIAVAQNTMQPTQVAATEEAAPSTGAAPAADAAAPAVEGAAVAEGTTGTIMGMTPLTAGLVGAGVLAVGVAAANSGDDNKTTTGSTSGTR